MSIPDSFDNNNNYNSFISLPSQDWDYLLVSSYHRQVNAQPVSCPVDSNISSNAHRSDTGELPSVSNWRPWFWWCYIWFPNFLCFKMFLGCTFVNFWKPGHKQQTWHVVLKGQTSLTKIGAWECKKVWCLTFCRCLLPPVNLWSWTFQLHSFLTSQGFSTFFTCSIRNCNWMSCREKRLHRWSVSYSSWPGNRCLFSYFNLLFGVMKKRDV